jgi:hypothetical protein
MMREPECPNGWVNGAAWGTLQGVRKKKARGDHELDGCARRMRNENRVNKNYSFFAAFFAK